MSERFYLGDPHVHSSLSDGRLTPGELGVVAAARGLDFLALTDHARRGRNPRPAVEAPLAWAGGQTTGVCLLRGQELSAGGRVHLLLLGLPQPLPRLRLERLGTLAGEVHAAGGVVILAHPWQAMAKSPESLPFLDRGFAEGHLDGLEVFSGALRPSDYGLWRRTFEHYLRQWAPCAPATLASSDWHYRGHGEGTLGVGCTWIRAAAHSPEALLDAIVRRQTVAVLQVAAALEDGLFRESLPFPERFRAHGIEWRENLCGPSGLVRALLAQRAEVERWLAPPAAGSGLTGEAEERRREVWRAARSARAAGNDCRALALLEAVKG